MQGKAIWALGFFSFLSGLNAITAIVLAINLGIEATFQPYLIDSLTGPIPVYIYLAASIIATLIFLGGTTAKVVSDLSNKELLNEINTRTSNIEEGQKLQLTLLESLKARVFLVDESLNAAKKDIAKGFGEQEKTMKQVYTNLVNRFDSKLGNVKDGIEKQIGEGFSEQEEMLKQFHGSLSKRFDTKLASVDEDMKRQLAKIDGNLQKYAQRVRRSSKTIMKQQAEIESIKLQLAQLEDEVTQPKPLLTSDCKTEDVRGIGENTANELREMGITNVGELVLTDPKTIAENTDMSEKTVEKLQGRAQLAMVPSVSEKDAVLLEEVGVTDRNDLANQDPLELGKKINGIFKVYVEEGKISEDERPTIEKIYSWVKFAKA